MSEVFITVMSGVSVFVLGQIINEAFIKRVNAFMDIVGRVDNRLRYYANVITNGPLGIVEQKEAIKILRELSCELESTHKQLPSMLLWFINNAPWWWTNLSRIPSKNNVTLAAHGLIFLHNSASDIESIPENHEEVERIRVWLKIPIYLVTP